jgi:hypothetical protein
MAAGETSHSPPRKTVRVRFGAQDEVIFPSWLEKESGLTDGGEASVRSEGEGVLLEPLAHHPFRQLQGMFRGKGLLRALAEERKRERETER